MAEIEKSNGKLIIDIGCGRFKTEGSIGVDIIAGGEEDVAHDLNTFPYPFEESSVDVIYANHILEHVDDFIAVMHELYRISKDKAAIRVSTPHASCIPTAWADPTHKRFFVKYSFEHFQKNNNCIYGFKTDIIVKKVELRYYLYNGVRKGLRITNKPLIINRFVNYIANFSGVVQDFFERFLSYYIGGFEEVYYELEVKKDK